MKKFFCVFIVGSLALTIVVFHYYDCWKSLWSLENALPIYSVTHQNDDTLRVVMIGDSWAGMRTDSLNNTFRMRLSELSGVPVALKTKGKGGEISRGVYQLMFEEKDPGTKKMIMTGPDYCVIFAGINDAAANLGVKQYIHHLKLIIDLLLQNDICPVIIEIPNVDIWNIYGKKPVKDLMVDFVRSLMAGSDMYNFTEYREALFSMLVDNQLMESVLYVQMSDWNGVGADVNKDIFLNDRIHLNAKGYLRLDSCIINAIMRDL